MTETLPNNLSDQELKWSYWFLTHQMILRRWVIGLLSVLSVVLYLYVGWQLVFYAIEYQPEDLMVRRLMYNEGAYVADLDGSKPIGLRFSSVNMIYGEGGRNDFVSQIINNNPNWYITFDYQFQGNQENGLKKKGFVLPGQTKYLMDLGLPTDGATMSITNQKWNLVADFNYLQSVRSRFEIADQKFVAGSAAGEANAVVFTIANGTAYSYWEAPIQVFLYNAGNVVGVNYVTLNSLKAGESREVEIYWNNKLPRITGFDIIPDVDILNPDNIIAPEGEKQMDWQ